MALTRLLDVNVLLALFDPHHVGHEAAHGWFARVCRNDWATCSVTEAGFIRVLSNPAYRTATATPAEAAVRLARFCESGGHTFWPDDIPPRISLSASGRRLQGHRQVTDFHLAALAARHEGQLATFDGRLARALAGTHLESSVTWVR